jgi:hypothetical protein
MLGPFDRTIYCELFIELLSCLLRAFYRLVSSWIVDFFCVDLLCLTASAVSSKYILEYPNLLS